VYGRTFHKLMQNLKGLHPALEALVLVDAYGKVIGRPGLDLRRRELCTLAAVATLTTGSITEFSPAGDLVREVKMPDVYSTNMCFGGPDMRTAYITLSDTGRLGMMQWPEPGLKLHFG